MAAPLPDSWFHTHLDALPVARPARRFLRARKTISHAWLRHHLHVTGLGQGLPARVVGGDDEVTAVASHLMAVPAGIMATCVPPLPPVAMHAVTAAAVAVLEGQDEGPSLLLDASTPADRKRLRILDKASKTWAARLRAMCSPSLSHAQKAALWTAEAHALARITRRLLHDGVHVKGPQLEELRHGHNAQRLRFLKGAHALTGVTEPTNTARKALSNSGMYRFELRALEQAGPLETQFITAALVDALVAGKPRDLALASSWGVSMVRFKRLWRRAQEAHQFHGVAPHPVAEPEGPRAEAVASQVAAWTQRVVLKNLDRLVNEIRETGELAALLAKASSGVTLTPQEWHKVREQLLDVCKAVPSLAVFALPGGAFLLPVLLKVLPFDIRPSSFRDPPAATPTPPTMPETRS